MRNLLIRTRKLVHIPTILRTPLRFNRAMSKSTASKQTPAMNITFLGTASAQPSSTRNHSALALRLQGDVWLFDCGEATQHQLQRSTVKMGKIKKVFITHTHGDHIFGLCAFMSTRSNGAGGMAAGTEDPRTRIDKTNPTDVFEIYGPYGTRGYVRAGLTYTHTLLDSLYVVHELRLPTDPLPTEDGCPIPLHTSELPSGRNIVQESDGTWRNIFTDEYVSVSAAPILHSCPCVGYAIQEHPLPGKIKNPKDYLDQIRAANAHPSLMRELQLGNSVILPDGSTLHGPPRRPGRKLVILGDTYDPSPIAELARDAHLLVHEATNSHLPALDSATKAEDTYESVEERTKSRGHSTPQMAGAFAKAITAKRLILNHFSSRYKADQDVVDGVDVDPSTSVASKIMMAIRDLAIDSYGSNNVTCARDFMSIDIEVPNEDDE